MVEVRCRYLCTGLITDDLTEIHQGGGGRVADDVGGLDDAAGL